MEDATKHKIKNKLEMPGIEPGAFHMQSERSTAELHPLVCFVVKRHGDNMPLSLICVRNNEIE